MGGRPATRRGRKFPCKQKLPEGDCGDFRFESRAPKLKHTTMSFFDGIDDPNFDGGFEAAMARRGEAPGGGAPRPALTPMDPNDLAVDAVMRNNEAALREALGRGADVNASFVRDDGEDWTLLTWAACCGRDGICTILLAAGADPNNTTANGDAPLYLALDIDTHGDDETAEAERVIACVRCLLDAGADPNLDDGYGWTPLHFINPLNKNAHHHDIVVQMLVSHGANIEVKNHLGDTPLARALRWGCRKTVLAFLRAGAAVKVLTHKQVNDKNANAMTKENMTLNDYMIDIVNNGGWDAHAKKHQDRLLGVVSRCAEELPREILRIIVSFWALPH